MNPGVGDSYDQILFRTASDTEEGEEEDVGGGGLEVAGEELDEDSSADGKGRSQYVAAPFHSHIVPRARERVRREEKGGRREVGGR